MLKLKTDNPFRNKDNASKLQIGHEVETFALKFLQENGLELLFRNFRSRFSEIDLICQDKDTLVFIEVRYRTNKRYGTAAESVHYGKQRKLQMAARYFLLKHPKFANVACRFDVVAVTQYANTPTVQWIQAAFY